MLFLFSLKTHFPEEDFNLSLPSLLRFLMFVNFGDAFSWSLKPHSSFRVLWFIPPSFSGISLAREIHKSFWGKKDYLTFLIPLQLLFLIFFFLSSRSISYSSSITATHFFPLMFLCVSSSLVMMILFLQVTSLGIAWREQQLHPLSHFLSKSFHRLLFFLPLLVDRDKLLSCQWLCSFQFSLPFIVFLDSQFSCNSCVLLLLISCVSFVLFRTHSSHLFSWSHWLSFFFRKNGFGSFRGRSSRALILRYKSNARLSMSS